MIYFSGFCLKNEEELFDFWLEKSDFLVAGFSYGAIKALEFALNSKKRLDRLILLSPAFFNNRDEKFKRLQLLHFKKDSNRYIQNFFKNASYGSNVNLYNYFSAGTYNQLKELLYYKWDISKLESLKSRGVSIEVILAQKDKIIDSIESLNFFKDIVTTYYVKDANHILKEID